MVQVSLVWCDGIDGDDGDDDDAGASQSLTGLCVQATPASFTEPPIISLIVDMHMVVPSIFDS